MNQENGENNLRKNPVSPVTGISVTASLLTQTGLPNVVYSGLAIYYEGRIHNFTEVTTVYMMRLTDEEIENYLKTGEYIGKAGGFGVQGLAGSFVERIDGDINNVIGLPLSRLAKELKTILRL
ncbi:hypothetical protein HHI36_004786 [Cryptolaemus montrouzieri]|uniref:Maf-like protein n=1 Tax=Cryptolaemus montrouzieri TaxID=559131 RepID=A0ABD2NS81_9CUCU